MNAVVNVPLAVVAALGSEVVLRSQFRGPVRVYERGHVGRLTSIQCDDEGLRVTVALDRDDESYWETFKLEEIEPLAGAVSFTLDLEGGRLISPPLPR